MKILAADTSTTLNTVALCEDSRPVAESTVDCGRSHAERLLSTVDWLLKEAGAVLDDVDLFAVSCGPGSFTGLRVGVATFKGLALAQRRPLIAVPTLDALARLIPADSGLVCPMLDAKMKEVFSAAFRFRHGARTKVMADRVCPVQSVLEDLDGPALFVGDGAVLYRDAILERMPDARILDWPQFGPRASAIAAEAVDLLGLGAETNAALAAPVYLRKSQAEENRDKALLP